MVDKNKGLIFIDPPKPQGTTYEAFHMWVMEEIAQALSLPAYTLSRKLKMEEKEKNENKNSHRE